MCHLCRYPTKSPPEGWEDDLFGPEGYPAKEFLRIVGSKRRRMIHRGAEYKISPATLRNEWRAIEARKQANEGSLRNGLKNLFERQIKALLDALREKAGTKKVESVRAKPQFTPLVVSTLLNWNEWFERTGDVTRDRLRSIIEEGYKTGQDRLAITGPDFTSQTPFVRQTLREITFQTQQVQNTFREMVAREIQRGLTENEDIPEIIERVAQKTQEQTGYRLRRTVRTASQGGFEAGQVDAYRDAGIQEMRWLSQRDGRVRSPRRGDRWNHRQADGQTVKINENFLITGAGGISESLAHPGDPSGSPGNVINCRCSTRPVS